ncbi:hypothetical protein ERJ75_001239200 [Trypanosoma vivax]|uniref:Uncharacterized protein n=1 Tax=Trypanosoma vivax (strain Y486) TaxID=1055687 RepID=G0TWN1_TRYVY|nr:hypothetical protein TRVL_09948 [Trypanosoma vivax]KAH8609193.1 hypothetical protein ERJ75_001239200 [Trypanosoma vivax]CCC48369.1 conserved hypothetical protein [Trypanosoma vivax Y486]
MGSEDGKNLLKTLERPDSYDSWIQGTHYSEKYLATLKRVSRPYFNPLPSKGKTVKRHATKNPHKCTERIQSSGRAPDFVCGNNEQVNGAGTPFDFNTALGVGAMQSSKRTSVPNHAKGESFDGILDVMMDDELESLPRNILFRSYYKVKDECPGAFPALLTPYQRPFWSYKTASVHDIPPADVTDAPNRYLPFLGYSLESVHNTLSTSLRSSLPTRIRPPTGPPCFAPTRNSSRWMNSMRK